VAVNKVSESQELARGDAVIVIAGLGIRADLEQIRR
jgi:hypothetical protein